MKKLKETHINETNILLDGSLVKGGILPSKISELTRIVTVQGDSVIEGPLYAAQLEIQNGEAHFQGAVFTQRELHVNSDAKGVIDFQKCVASSSSVVSRARKCDVSFHSDINAKSVSLVNAFIAGSIYADEITLENCVVIGGIFATQSVDLNNCIIGTFNAPSIHVEGTIQMLLPTAFSVEKIHLQPQSGGSGRTLSRFTSVRRIGTYRDEPRRGCYPHDPHRRAYPKDAIQLYRSR